MVLQIYGGVRGKRRDSPIGDAFCEFYWFVGKCRFRITTCYCQCVKIGGPWEPGGYDQSGAGIGSLQNTEVCDSNSKKWRYQSRKTYTSPSPKHKIPFHFETITSQKIKCMQCTLIHLQTRTFVFHIMSICYKTMNGVFSHIKSFRLTSRTTQRCTKSNN